jgi:hypothetical protein
MAEIIRIVERGNKDRSPLRLVRCSNCAAEYSTREGPGNIAKLTKCKNCYPIVHDEFTHLDVSTARKWQLRRLRDGLCTYSVECIERPGATKELCAEHRELQNARRRVP